MNRMGLIGAGGPHIGSPQGDRVMSRIVAESGGTSRSSRVGGGKPGRRGRGRGGGAPGRDAGFGGEAAALVRASVSAPDKGSGATRVIGRVGALAVALGVGTAVASMP